MNPVPFPPAGRWHGRLAWMLAVLAVLALLAVAWLAYRPGLSGDFLFDDFGNLPALGATGPVRHWATFWRYITSGNADPTGRPLTLLTFLIDARDWPASPYPFKLTNLILHLLNGALLVGVLWKLGCALRPLDARAGATIAARTQADRSGLLFAALFGAGAWLLHPLLVSTTLYIVQREAMLPATFVLIGMLGWMASRDALARGRVRRGLIGMGLSAWLCTLLAVLSKANGALLPALLLLVEWIVLSRRAMPTQRLRRCHRRALGVLLVLPSVLVAAWLLYLLPGAIAGAPATRGWTIGERLLTQARVLADYLRLLFIPRANSTGLFNDQFAVSSGWLHPASTLPCVVLILALVGAGFALPKRHPAIALALLFYFTAQIMESGWIPLELYYEHRNYLPAMLLFWPIGLALGKPGALRFLKLIAAVAVLAVLAILTAQRAALWGDGFRQAQVWAAINPASARAQTNAALYDMAQHRPRLAAARLRLALPRHPDDIQIPVNLIGAECMLGAVQPRTVAATEDALQRTRLGGEVAFHWFNQALEMARTHACSGLDFGVLQATLDAARRNPYWRDAPGRLQDLAHLQGQLDIAEGKPDAALRAFDRALAFAPGPGTALEQAAYLGAHGFPALGLAHLDYFANLPPAGKPRPGMARIHAWVLAQQGWWPRELAYLRRNLADDLAERSSRTGAAR